MGWFVDALKKYAVFHGRARRKEYWYFELFATIIGLIFPILFSVYSMIMIGTYDGTYDPEQAEGPFRVFAVLYWLGILIPSIAVAVRRLHDTDRSGGWIFIILIPIVGPIILLVFLAQDSTPGNNRFGPNPKGVAVLGAPTGEFYQ